MASILAVDDSPSMRALLTATLESAGHEVSVASNGMEALAVLKTKHFNLIISDLNMPLMDGMTFIRKVRMMGAYAHTPILVLTTVMDPEQKKLAKAAGATGWLVKPFDPQQLNGTIRKVLD